MRTSANRFVRLFAASAALLASAGAAEEASLLDRPGWVRTCDKGQLVWNDGPDGKSVTLLQEKGAKVVRAIDPDRVLVASATGGSSPGNYNACDMRPLPLKDVIYQMHFYAPFFLTHAGLYGTTLLPDDPYPGTEKRGTHWTKKEVGDVMDYMNDFVERWGAQIYVGEFSCMSKQPGAAQWLDDVADLIEAHGYKFWTFHSYGEFYGWNLESIRDEETGKLRNIRDGETTDRLEVMKKHWARNRE